ncbi:hypothetical protein ACZ11_10540 [Lysinibacillus xylanilyticus]|uniref:Lipoprotein n=1 Tax=Lysinibacillus xylanilyticus TaxID=582475 RepID=A0A0K9FEI9_9BACI|nr:hypothetical protein [Lysinibacillus xylanilyticus]KMY32546.1 hypothetical protein ACZ11_10540 [Lysinibacillus xylanilyticus]
MKKIYILGLGLGLMLCLITACSSKQENVSPNEEQNTNIKDENIHLANAIDGSYHSIYITELKDNEEIIEQVLYGDSFEQFLKVLKETTLIKEPLPEDHPFPKNYHQIVVQGDKDVVTIFIEENTGEQLVSLLANDVIPSGVYRATNIDILKYIEKFSN